MTHSPAHPDAIRQLHALLAEDELSAQDSIVDDGKPVLEQHTREAVSMIGLEAMSPDARDLLLRLTDYSENLEPTARESLVSAAERGLQWRSDNAGPLPTLLFARRREDGLSPEQVSIQLDIPAKALTDIESGASSVRSLTPQSVAAWIHLLRVGTHDAELALNRGVERRQRSARAAGSRQPLPVPDADDAFIQEVLALLRKLQGG